MAHQVENMFSVGEAPWHKLGHVVSEAPTAEAAIRLAGLDWKVKKEPIFWKNGEDKSIASHVAIVRDSDHKTLGVVGAQYHPLQNEKAFQFFDRFLEANEALFETAGSLQGGKRVWILARLKRAPIEVTKGDAVVKYLLLSNGHDGSLAVRVGFTPVRVVCANTLAMSHSAKESRLIRILHSSKVEFNLDRVRDIVNAADAEFEATAEQYRYLASRSDVSEKNVRDFVKVVYRQSDIVESQRKALSQENLQKEILKLFETAKGNDLPGVRGTWWAAYNAVTYHLTHEKIDDDARRLSNLWYGNGERMNREALKVAVEMASS